MSNVSKPALAYASSASAAASRSSVAPSFSRSATCQRPQIRRLIARSPPIVVRSGLFAIERLEMDFGGELRGRRKAGEMARDHLDLAENAARPQQQDRAKREAD